MVMLSSALFFYAIMLMMAMNIMMAQKPEGVFVVASSSSSSSQQRQQEQRNMQTDDALLLPISLSPQWNELLETVVIQIDGNTIGDDDDDNADNTAVVSINEKIGLIDLDLRIEQITCTEIQIGTVDIQHTHIEAETQDEGSMLEIYLGVNDVSGPRCEIVYDYKYGFLQGQGIAEVVTTNNSASTNLQIKVPNSNENDTTAAPVLVPPSLVVTECAISMEIVDINFIEADFTSNLLGLVERFLRDMIEEEIEEYGCTELTTSGVLFLNQNILGHIHSILSTYNYSNNNDDEDSTTAATAAATATTIIPNGYDYDYSNNAINFQNVFSDGDDNDTPLGKLIEMGLQELGGNGNGDDDELGINALIRSYILDENNALVVTIDDKMKNDVVFNDNNNNPFQFEFHNSIIQADIAVNEIRIIGLDSMTQFNPLMVTGDYTLRNEFGWEYIRLEVDVSLNIRPSSLENTAGVIQFDTTNDKQQEPEPIIISENLTLGFGVETINVAAEVFALIDVETLKGFTIGSVLAMFTATEDNTNDNDSSSFDLLSCLLSAVKLAQFTELIVTTEQIMVPTVILNRNNNNNNGSLSSSDNDNDGLDRTITEIMDILFDIYHNTIVNSDIIPNLFNTTIKKFLNDQLLLLTKSNQATTNNSCSNKYDESNNNADEVDRYIDFREFFGDGTNNNSNNNEYGSLPSLLHDMLDEELLQNDPITGMPKINTVVIEPLTLKQSGVIGTVILSGSGGESRRNNNNKDDDDDVDIDDYLINVDTNIQLGGLDADIKIRANNIKIENLDTIVSPLIVLESVPTEPYYLNNSITLGDFNGDNDIDDNNNDDRRRRPVSISTKFAFEIIDDTSSLDGTAATNISNELDIHLDLYDTNVIGTFMIKILKSDFFDLPVVDIFDYNCWIAMIPAPNLNEQGIRIDDEAVTAAVVDFVASVGKLDIDMTCIDCSSPGVIELTELLSSTTTSTTANTDQNDDITDVVNRILASVQKLVTGDLVQVRIDRLINNAHKKCHDPNFVESIDYKPLEAIDTTDNSTLQYLMLLGIVSIVLILLVALVVLFLRWFTRRRHRRWLSTLPTEQVNSMKQLQQKDDTIEFELNCTTRSMFQSSDDIPCIVRWSMPVIIIGNIGLFLSGHLNLGATVNIQAEIAGEIIKVDNFFEFSMAKSTIDIWNAGGKELAILILIFSGIWPYTKQLMTLALWFTPTSWVSVSNRGSALLWLDWLAKWSMIDIFVLIISLAAFRVSINSPSTVNFLPEDFYSINLLVVPLWGLYSNLIAQLVSQISSHFIIHYHRKIRHKAEQSHRNEPTKGTHINNGDGTDHREKELEVVTTANGNGKSDGKKLLLRIHQFGRPHRGITETLIVRNWVNCLLIIFGIAVVACILAGCILATFSVEILGLIGVAVESGQEFREAKNDHSVFTVIKLLMEEAQFLDTAKDYVGLGSFSFIFVLTVLIVPVCQSIALLMQWFVPMTAKNYTRASISLEVLQAWQYAEVYLIAIFVASWQLGPISSFMVNEYCNSLDGFFAEMVFYGIVKEEDAQCFSVKSSIEAGFYVLAAGAVLLHLLNAFVTNAAKQRLRDSVDQQQQREEVVKAVEIFTHSLESSTISSSDDACRKLEVSYDEHQQHQADDSSTIELSETVVVHPVPVLFTDKFRWLLIPSDDHDINNSSHHELGLNSA